MPRRWVAAAILFTLFFSSARSLWAFDWIHVAPNPAYSRDLAMGASTVALPYPVPSQSINPAGIAIFQNRKSVAFSIVTNPGGAWQYVRAYADDGGNGRSSEQKVGDALRLSVSGVLFRWHVATLGMLSAQPVMTIADTVRYEEFDRKTPLREHQNSVVLALALHPRVTVGGRIDRFYDFDRPLGESYSYGVILRPRGVKVGVEYQRFPQSGARVWHPLDRRRDATTTAGLAMTHDDFTVTVQVMNLTQSETAAFLEPHAGIEWRPLRAMALRAGGMQFSRSSRWAWTAGVGLLDANWLRGRSERLPIPDDVLQLSVAMIYDRRRPELGIGSLTMAWRF